MDARYFLTALAIDDLDEIYTYISKDSMKAAERVQAEILRSCALLGDHPWLGKRFEGIVSREVRIKPVAKFPNYEIVYLPETRPLQIVAIVHGRRNISSVLGRRGLR